ncbi:MAG: 2-phospho-L-lactate guanylyltransferase [Bacillati bacterium ANGP1]|uniref:2-phospho-L-lactate guanylyltransferase n=1 Tax=Candidatus Segetimicrobium genomatis TaxID=2569760 RepID=A0A537JW14_9BACT|nr:MAG: 2-phospho-L-lactate guanylyltransferase [Terrabacteria group bacterium ANGP1]
MRRHLDDRPCRPTAAGPGAHRHRGQTRHRGGRNNRVRVRAIVPQKPLPDAKSRLAGALSGPARATLSLALLRTVCATLRAVPDIEDTIIMTPDVAVQAQAAAWGARAILDPYPELNAALAEAFLRLAGGSHGILVVAADLPFLRPADIIALLRAGRARSLALAPSKDGGTNAMLVPPGITFRPAYGPGSLAAHRRRSRALGLGIVEVRRPGLTFDVDTEADLVSVRAATPPSAAG